MFERMTRLWVKISDVGLQHDCENYGPKQVIRNSNWLNLLTWIINMFNSLKVPIRLIPA